MSLHEYMISQEISKHDPPFYALLFAMMRKADDKNTSKIKAMWPDEWKEMQRRYNAPLGVLEEDGVDPEVIVRTKVDISGAVIGIDKVFLTQNEQCEDED